MPASSASRKPLSGEHIDFLERQARALGVPTHEVEDVVQDTLVKAIELWPEFRGEAKPTTWLYRILLNVWRNNHRRVVRRIRKHHDYETQQLVDGGTASKFEAERGLAVRELQAFVDSLPPEAREAFIERAIGGLDRREAATSLGIAPAVLDRRLAVANSCFDEQFEHRTRSQRRGQVPSTRRAMLLFPMARWWVYTRVGGLCAALVGVVGLSLATVKGLKAPTREQAGERGVARRTLASSPAELGSALAPELEAPIEVTAQPTLDAPVAVRARVDNTPASAELSDPQRLVLGRRLRVDGELEAALAEIQAINAGGPLARQRWGNEVGILCALGRVREAAAVAERWLASYPDDQMQLRRSCVKGD